MGGGTLVLAAAAGGWLLLAAGVVHLARPGNLVSALRRHGFVPAAVASPATLGLGTLEVLAGSVGLAAFGIASTGLWTASLLVNALLYGSFTLYLGLLWHRRGRVPCGCFGSRETVGPASVSRSAALAVLSVSAALVPDPAQTWRPLDRGALLAAALALAVMCQLGVSVLSLSAGEDRRPSNVAG